MDAIYSYLLEIVYAAIRKFISPFGDGKFRK